MRETTESIAKRRACGVSTESIDMLFAPRKLRVRGNGKYFTDHWAGVTRIVVASTGRIVAVFEDSRDTQRTKNLLNNDSSERKSKAEIERLREKIKCGHSMELDSLARERDEANAEIERLRRDCAEAYQVVGTLSCVLLDSENVSSEDITKALDNLIAAANGEPRPHDDLLPFPAIAEHG